MTVVRKPLANLLLGFAKSRFSVRESESVAVAEASMRCLRVDLIRADGIEVRGFLTGPAREWQAQPAILYCHAHGNRYDIGASELLQGRPALQPEPYGLALAKYGIVAFAIDLPCFGERAIEPESLAAKRHLWQGTTLFGEMLADLAGAITVLETWPGLDGMRIGTFGISMGATLAFWLAALDPRVKCLAHLCCFADLAELVRQNAHDQHGLYMTVPGLLAQWRTGKIAGLAAPRPQLAAMGARDPLTPLAAIEIALADVRAAYAAAGAPRSFSSLVDPQAGHHETEEMRRNVLRFFEIAL
jgi:dienelactone hydrolase